MSEVADDYDPNDEDEEDYDEDYDDVEEYSLDEIAALEAQAGLTGQTEHLSLQQRLELLSQYNGIKISKPRAQRRPPIGGKWTKEEDEELRQVVETHGAKCWKKVAEQLRAKTRTDVQCLHRWNKVLKVKVFM